MLSNEIVNEENNSELAFSQSVECPTFLTWSHFIQGKLEISNYLSWDKLKKVNKVTVLYFIFGNYSGLTCVENSLILISWLQKQLIWIYTVNVWFHTVFKRVFRVYCLFLIK